VSKQSIPRPGSIARAHRIVVALGLAATFAFSAAPALAASTEYPSEFGGPTEPAKAPKGIKIGIVSCAASLKGCQAQADSAAEASKLVGWEVNMFDGKANPKTQATAMLDALAWGANVIVAVSLDYRTIQLPLKEAKKAGVPVVAVGQGGDTPNPLPVLKDGELAWDFAVDVDNRALGSAIADWIIKDSDGKANIIVYNDPEFEGVVNQHHGVMDTFAAKCSGCTVVADEFTASTVATTLGQQVVGYLRAHPDVTYVYAPYDPSAFAMAAAIRQAGMGDRIRLVSLLGNEENIALIRKGDVQVATAAFDTRYSGFATVDQIIRYLNKQPLFEPHGENVPYTILDKTNLPEKGNWASSNGYVEKFQALWK
jgi:ABC-type sugar transport system substrate-binding protein